jgi:4-hydroxy-2-oxoheptanedioate aldolase
METFKNLVKSNIKLVGVWQTVPSIIICDVLISSKVDFIIFDMEHSVFSFNDVLEHSLLCKANNIGSVVRISKLDKQLISLAYDCGVDVIQIPNLETIEEINEIESFISFNQKKGYSPFTVSESYNGINKSEPPLISIHIENRNIMNNLNQIVKNNIISIYFYGLFDISRSYGKLGEVNDKEIIEDVKNSMSIVKNVNKTVGFIVNDVNDLKKFDELGTYISYSSDVYILKNNLVKDINFIKSK